MAKAKQETLTARVSFEHMLESRKPVCQDSDTGYFAADMVASKSDATEDGKHLSYSEDDDGEGTPAEEANELGSSSPPGTYTTQLQLYSPPKPIADEDCDDAKVNAEAETNPANLTA